MLCGSCAAACEFEDGGADADALVTQWIGGTTDDGILYGHIYASSAPRRARTRANRRRRSRIYADVLKPAAEGGAAAQRDVRLRVAVWRPLLRSPRAKRDLGRRRGPMASQEFSRSSLPFIEMPHGAVLRRRPAIQTSLGEARLPS